MTILPHRSSHEAARPRNRQAPRKAPKPSEMSSEQLIKLAAIKGFRSVIVDDEPESEPKAARPVRTRKPDPPDDIPF